MTKLSVNINKIAVIRNSRGGNLPDVIEAAKRIEGFGAQGITVHPRPDERHIRYSDVRELKRVVTTELNIEGNPFDPFVELVMEVVPAQVTLVPDAHDAITSNAGWNTVKYRDYLRERVELFHSKGIRVSVFVNPDAAMVRGAAECGADRVELYTEGYAAAYAAGPEAAVRDYVGAAGRYPGSSTIWGCGPMSSGGMCATTTFAARVPTSTWWWWAAAWRWPGRSPGRRVRT